MRYRYLALSGPIALAMATPAQAADKFTLGFLTTLTGPAAVVGNQLRDGMQLAMDHLDGKIGGLPTRVVIEDDQQKPDIGLGAARKLLQSEKVDAIAGVPWSHVMLAIHGPITKSRTILVSSNAGPSQIAGKECSEYFFSTSWQGDNYAEAMGAHFQNTGKQNVYLMAPNYAAGRDVLNGFKRFYKGSIVGEVYTGLTQTDYAAEITQLRAASPSSVFAFYPGGLGIQFVKQYAQAGLRDRLPLYTAYTLDNTSMPALGESAVGLSVATFWSTTMDNPVSKRFVADFEAKFKYAPAEYAAQAYDSIMLLDSGVRGVKGKIDDKKAFIAALEKADFKSVRGKFRFNTNHFPIQDFYAGQVVMDGGKPTIKLGDVILKDHKDAYASECPMK